MAAKKMLTEEQLKVVKQAIWNTWNYIGYDAEEMCDGDNECAIEMCIDADRLTMCSNQSTQTVGEEATAILNSVIEFSDYKKVLKYLSKQIQLV